MANGGAVERNADDALFIGVMSGTSLDGVDAVIASFPPLHPLAGLSGVSAGGIRVAGSAFVPFPATLRDELLNLQSAGDDELVRSARAANALAEIYAEAATMTMQAAGARAADVAAIGVHGQTVRHCPAEGWSIQLNNPARLAERLGIDVVADFRSRDLAAGGQGAPLVPAFHAALFADPHRHRVIVNIGGMANLTDLPPSGTVRGFDTGPGNVLLDGWYARHHTGTFDRGGAWAASGTCIETLLETLLADPFFNQAPPKSTGRDRFNPGWLDARLSAFAGEFAPADVQATLLQLTATSIVEAIERHAGDACDILVCGGGARNVTLMAALAARLAPRQVHSTDTAGVAAEHVEALAFAWLARETLARRPANLPAVTGAAGPRILGAVTPA